MNGIDFNFWCIETLAELKQFEEALSRFYARRVGRWWKPEEVRAYQAMRWNATEARSRLTLSA